MQYILVDIADREYFYPFSLTRSVAELRVGIYSFQERWEQLLNNPTNIYTVPYLQTLYNQDFLSTTEAVCFINVTCIPNNALIEQINLLKSGEKLISKTGKWIATCSTERSLPKILLAELAPVMFEEALFIENSMHLLQMHAQFIRTDFDWITTNKLSQPINETNRTIGKEQIFIEEGAQVSCANLNATDGPIYIGKEAIVMEGVSIRGPFVLGHKAVVKMNTSIYGATTVGPYSLAGGEIKNAVLMGFTNKGHEGYLGDSIVGFWCNLGAGTSNSNIKNTAGKVQIWNEAQQVWDTVGQKMGMLMGDYSRFAIQSSINTGSYIGVSANVFGKGLLPKHIPNFTWGILPGYQFEKVIEDLDNWKKLKGFSINEAEISVLKHLYKGV